MNNFLLASTELRVPYKPRSCHVVRRLRSELRDDLALVNVYPPIPSNTYDTKEDVTWVVLAARHQGDSLFPVNRWPLPVYICRTKGDTAPTGNSIMSDTLSILDWGEIRQADDSS